MLFITVLTGSLMLAAATYAHYQLPNFTAGRSRLLVSRSVLLVVGIAFGLAAAAPQADETWKALAFLFGFGAVHVPAAFVLFVKRQRGAGKS